MPSTNRLLHILFLGTIAAVISACASPAVQECGSTGILCPSGTHCAAAQGICLPDTNTCGNAHLDPGEICDDGNTVDGDGCSHDCKSNETCGNGTIDRAKGEVCDDGNTNDGDGCSHDCKSLETCGNGIKDINEACDDGNNNDNDGCAHDCKSTEVCGNGIVDREVGEVCDPPTAGTCAPDCRSLLSCGNKVIDPGEECDDGLADNSDDKDCRSDCVINRCGDGRPNLNGAKHHEDCDAGPLTPDHIRTAVPTERADCNIDCTTPKCGDGKVNHSFKPNGVNGEQCDNVMVVNMTIVPLNADDADCTADCQLNVCGDGHFNTVGPLHVEGCDDGNRIDSDSCTNACVAKACGDGILGPNEQCDDGPGNNGPGLRCNTICKFNVCGDGDKLAGLEQCDDGVGGVQTDSATCDTDCTFAVCGDGHLNTLAGEGCDHGANNGKAGDTCSTTCHIVTCGNGLLEQGEECDDGPGNNGTNLRCNANCKLNVCGDGDTLVGIEQCDAGSGGVKKDSATCDNDCTSAVCGDGHLNTLAGEGCDHGANNGKAGDTCSTTCHIVTCGNGLLEQGEECDDGPGNNGTNLRCNANCKLNVCGDGDTLVGIEQCDAGSGGVKADSATCDNDCTSAVCGDGHLNTLAGEGCDHGSNNGKAGDTCSTTCHVVTCSNGLLEQGEECDDGPGNNGSGRRCNANCKLNICGDGDTLTGIEQCDAGSGGVKKDSATCDIDCTAAVCGDGYLNMMAGETCDHGALNGTMGNTCDSFCHSVACGNGIVDFGEQCDPGTGVPATNSSTCDKDCTAVVCGDGLTNMAANEACDDGSKNGDLCDYGDQGCSRCNATCTALVSPGGPFCGDGAKNGPEACDQGIFNNTQCAYNNAICLTTPTICKADCSGLIPSPNGPFCGDGTVQAAFNEQCDPGGNTLTPVDTAICDHDCSLAICGDGYVNGAASELCDDGNANDCGTCSADCTTRSLAATGTIAAVDASQLQNNGDTFTLADGIHTTATTFEFCKGGLPAAGNVAVNIHGGDSSATVATEIRDAINGVGATLDITVTGPIGVILTLTNDHIGTAGNTGPIAETVMDTGFVTTGMAGGTGAVCAAGISCATGADCLSGTCGANHRCQ